MQYKNLADHMPNYFWRVFHSNGWSVMFDEDFSSQNRELHEDLYEITLLEEYQCTVTAHVITESSQLGICGQYGVMWLDVAYEYKDPAGYDWEQIEEMQAAIIDAEDNLLAIGIPFEDNYKFHGKNRANKKRRNDALIRKLDLKAKAERNYDEFLKFKKELEEKKKQRKAETQKESEEKQ